MVLRSTPVRAGQRFPEPLAPLPLIECVAVWALKLPVPHTDVLKPTSHKVFLRNYWNPKELAANICHKPILPNSVFLYHLINASRNIFLDALVAASNNDT